MFSIIRAILEALLSLLLALPCGTRADSARQAQKREAAATTMVQRHRAADTAPMEPDPDTKARQRIERLERGAAQIRDWLTTHPDE